VVAFDGDEQQRATSAHLCMVHFGGRANLQGEHSVTEVMPLHETVAGAVIGRNGGNLRDLKAASTAHIDISPYTGPASTRQVVITGTVYAVQYARRLVQESVRPKLPRTTRSSGTRSTTRTSTTQLSLQPLSACHNSMTLAMALHLRLRWQRQSSMLSSSQQWQPPLQSGVHPLCGARTLPPHLRPLLCPLRHQQQ